MSVRILQNKCVGCGRCLSVCPGNLLKKGEDGKVHIRNIRDCWGCTACLKECHTGAILYFLGADTVSYTHLDVYKRQYKSSGHDKNRQAAFFF